MLCRASRVSSSATSAGTCGGTARTSTSTVQSAVPLRPSSARPVTAYEPGAKPAVGNRTDDPEPAMLPALAFQEKDTGSSSGSFATAVISTVSPAGTSRRSAEQLMVGGRLGRASTRILAEQSAVPSRPLSTRTLMVYRPGRFSEELHRTSGPVPSTAPSLADQE